MASAEHPAFIGPYRILDVLGEGGMGTVYRAEQREPVHRRVAVKVVRLGLDGEEVLARFAAERQALARMNHDAIAKVFDAGATEDGQPYFAMEYVPGIPITEYCDKHGLDVRERLALFRKVCLGVQHAHQKGVLHRDLKPANVLVSEEQAVVSPKIIDFGLARATDHHLADATLMTQAGQILGTLEYMSPEQAESGGQDLDTRTDVYALGVILYELLTGALPFGSEDLRRAGLLEARRMILEDEAPRPSARLDSLGPARSTNAGRRRTTAAALARAVRGELDWIVMKAIEKDRNRRYATASELAQDVERHLADEPISAGPPTAWYVLRKFAVRERAKLALGGAVLLTLAAIAWVWSGEAERDAFERDALLGADLTALMRYRGRPPTARLDGARNEERQHIRGLVDELFDQLAAAPHRLDLASTLARVVTDFEFHGRSLQATDAPRLRFHVGAFDCLLPNRLHALVVARVRLDGEPLAERPWQFSVHDGESSLASGDSKLPADEIRRHLSKPVESRAIGPGLEFRPHSRSQHVLSGTATIAFFDLGPPPGRDAQQTTMIARSERLSSALEALQQGELSRIRGSLVGDPVEVLLPAFRFVAMEELPANYPVPIVDASMAERFADHVQVRTTAHPDHRATFEVTIRRTPEIEVPLLCSVRVPGHPELEGSAAWAVEPGMVSPRGATGCLSDVGWISGTTGARNELAITLPPSVQRGELVISLEFHSDRELAVQALDAERYLDVAFQESLTVQVK